MGWRSFEEYGRSDRFTLSRDFDILPNTYGESIQVPRTSYSNDFGGIFCRFPFLVR
jgi:hypothetical protein